MPKKPSLKKPNFKKPNIKKPALKKPTKQVFKNSLKSVKMWTFVLLIAGLGMFGYASYLWYNNIFTDKERIFYDMIDKSLNTQAVTRQVTQSQGARTEVQTFLLTFSPDPALKSTSTVEEISQTRDRSKVSTETVGTKDADFIRYTDINIPASSGGKTDYSKLLNTWAKRESSAEGAKAQFLNDAIFAFIPFGNFNASNRVEMIKMLKDNEVYKFQQGKIDYNSGRPIYTVSVGIKPRGLVQVLQKYNELTGIGDPALLDPSQYQDYHSIYVNVEIDMLSRHLNKIAYSSEDDRVETYAAYGVTGKIDVPTDTISVEELQSRAQ